MAEKTYVEEINRSLYDFRDKVDAAFSCYDKMVTVPQREALADEE